MNKSKEVLKDLIHNYTEDLELYEAALQNPQLDKKHRYEILFNMRGTVYKLQKACEDLLREEIQNG